MRLPRHNSLVHALDRTLRDGTQGRATRFGTGLDSPLPRLETAAPSVRRLVQEMPLFQPRRYVLLGDVADVLADERFDFEFESVLEHQLEFLLPRFLLSEPGILRDLTGPFDVLIVQLDLNAGTELAALIIVAAQAKESGLWNCHPA